MVRSTVLLSGIVLALGFCGVATAEKPHLVYPRPACPNCPPNAATFGYFATTWRQWPCEERPEITNPRSIGAERLSTPPGREQLPLPQATAAPQQVPTAPKGGSPATPGVTIPEPQAPAAPTTSPGLPKGEKPATPPAEGGLPGLPVEPEQPQTPGLPKTGSTPSPSLDLNAPSPSAKEMTKPAAEVPSQEKLPVKEGVKPTEPPKLQDPPKSSSPDKALPGARYEITPPTATAAASLEQPGTVIAPIGGLRAEWGQEWVGTHRAEAITSTTPERATNAVQATNYKIPEPPVQLQIIDRNVADRPVP